MGSQVGPKKKAMTGNARPSIWFRQIDDTFTIFDSNGTAILSFNN